MLEKHSSLLGEIEVETKYDTWRGEKVISYDESRRIDRMIAYNFLSKHLNNEELLTSREVEGIIYFIGINVNKLSKLMRINRGTLSNVIKGRKPSAMLCKMLLDMVEKELIFPNYFKSQFEPAIKCIQDEYYCQQLITNKAA